MYTPTITKYDLKEGDYLFYRSTGTFGIFIRMYEAVLARDWKHFFVAFSHVARVAYNRELDTLQRIDAMEGYKTGFRECVGQAYVFRWIQPMTGHQEMVWRQYMISRIGSLYNLFGAVTGVDNVFRDYCSDYVTDGDTACGKIKPINKRLRPHQVYKTQRKRLVFIGVII